jgi:hypothetical protein
MPEFDDAIDYSKQRRYSPQYTLIEHSPITSSSITLTASAVSKVSFRLGGDSSVINPYDSMLSFLYTPGAAGASPRFNYISLLGAPLSNVYARLGSAELMNLDFGLEYSNCVGLAALPMETYLAMDIGGTLSTTAATGVHECYTRNNADTTAAGADRHNNDGATIAYTETAYFIVGSDNTADPIVQFRVALKDAYPFSLFSCNKNFPLNSLLQLDFSIAGNSFWTFYSASASNPASSPVATAASGTVSNIKLYMSRETNQDIIDATLAKFNASGLDIRINYPMGRQDTQSGTSQNVSVLNVATGSKSYLKAIFWAFYNNTNSANTIFDHDQGDGTTRISSFRTLMNSKRLNSESSDIYLTQAEPLCWKLAQQKFKNSPLVLSRGGYQYNFVWADFFDFNGSASDLNLAYDEEFGLPLNGTKQYNYTIQATTASATNRVLSWSIISRVLHLQNGQPEMFDM